VQVQIFIKYSSNGPAPDTILWRSVTVFAGGEVNWRRGPHNPARPAAEASRVTTTALPLFADIDKAQSWIEQRLENL
jgi:hypothetical protein